MAMLLCAAMVCGLTSCNREEDGDLSSGEWIDLGLPSGLLWASCNIGANSPEEFGNYYAWGETQTKEVYDWDTYTYGDFDSEWNGWTIYKYNTQERYGTVDNKTVLEASDDVATAVLGAGARIPTHDDWDELINNTTAEWTKQNEVKGWKFTAANGNSIFLPDAGSRYNSELLSSARSGYWSSSLYTNDPISAWIFLGGDGNGYVSGMNRTFGYSVRAVRASQN